VITMVVCTTRQHGESRRSHLFSVRARIRPRCRRLSALRGAARQVFSIGLVRDSAESCSGL
jgi:hypothetical protein